MPFLKDERNEKLLRANIEPVAKKDYTSIEQSKEFAFDWRMERDNDVYKIYLISKKKEILGLMSIIDYKRETRIHINLLEIQAKNQGRGKRIDWIAGCLIAFACQLSFARGYEGFVSLRPKTELIALYRNKYGFRKFGLFLFIEKEAADFLVQKYLVNENE